MDSALERTIANECLLVLIEAYDADFGLIEHCRGLAAALNASWIVVFVQTSGFRTLSDRTRARSLELLRFAESRGAEAATLHGDSSMATVADFARLRGVTRIVLRSPAGFGWRAFTHYRQVAVLRRLAPQAQILAVDSCESVAGSPRPPAASPPQRESGSVLGQLRRCLLALAVTAVCTFGALPFAGRVDLINIVMIYMLGAALSGLLLGRIPSALTAFCNILAIDYFFVPPMFSFMVIDTSYLVTLAVMLLVTLIIANLMAAVRQRTEAAGAREQQTAALYEITRQLAVEDDVAAMTHTAVRHIGEVLQARAQVVLCDRSGQLEPSQVAELAAPDSDINIEAVRAAAERRERVGLGTQSFAAEPAQYLPLRGSRNTIGVLIVDHPEIAHPMLSEQQRLLEAIADRLALALERVRLTEDAHAAHLVAERAAMRNTLLASISHDLRTPLSAIAGAGSIVAQHDFALDFYRRMTLGRLIEDKAKDMSDLLGNVLELVRLESGADALNRDWHYLSDLVGLAITRHEGRLAGWIVTTDLPEDLPMMLLDSNLIMQVFSNLLENAVKYTPPGTRISISAQRSDGTVRVTVEDTGPGLGSGSPENLFEKFARGRIEGTTGGIGLGLAICRVVTRLHGGDIMAQPSPLGGARFEITLPIGADEPCATPSAAPIA